MKYRIFELRVELLPDNPQRTPQRDRSLALGYTSKDSLKDAEALFEEFGQLFRVKVVGVKSHQDFESLEEVKEPISIQRLKKTESYPFCDIALIG
ncbi:hypothetical protein GALL_161550 [mine drainage metagenome]|uniref:Uncharacterized protein n=1 Tax=mine drainage metagenome TaxID=410659 RepID=A0A1J5SCC9_9ZZZZ